LIGGNIYQLSFQSGARFSLFLCIMYGSDEYLPYFQINSSGYIMHG